MQLEEYREMLALEFGMKDSGFELIAMNRWASEGVREVLKRTHIHQEHVDLDLASTSIVGDWEIGGVTNKPIAILELYVPGDPLRFLREQSAAEIIRHRQTLTNTQGPYYYHWAGEELLMLAPASTTEPLLRALLVPYPTPLSVATDDPATDSLGGIPEEFQEPIYTWMCWKASRVEGKASPKSPKDYWEIFQGQIADMRADLRQRGSRRMSPARVGYPHAGFGRRNDVYPQTR